MFTGVVSFYELWLLAYDTPKEDMGKVCSGLIGLGITDIEGQIRREQVYDALCGWKETAPTPRQAQMLRDALEKVELGTRWLQIYGMYFINIMKHFYPKAARDFAHTNNVNSLALRESPEVYGSLPSNLLR